MRRERCRGTSSTAWQAILLSLGAAMLGSAQPPAVGRPTFHIQYTTHAPRIEELLGGAPATAGPATADFRQRQPRDGEPTSQDTAAYLLYDDRNLYVVFVCKDEPDKIRAHMSRRDAISDDDKVGVSLDPFLDGRRAAKRGATLLSSQRTPGPEQSHHSATR